MFGVVIYLSKLSDTMWSAIQAFFSTLRRLAQGIGTCLLLILYHSSCTPSGCRLYVFDNVFRVGDGRSRWCGFLGISLLVSSSTIQPTVS